MNQPIQKIDYRGCTIVIYPDQDARDPREWDCHYSQLWCFHKRYGLGDYNSNPYDHRDFDSWTEMREQIHRDHDVILISPLYLYDHSGITIKMGPFSGLPQGHARFDTMQIGFAVVTRQQVMKLQGGDRKGAWKYITSNRVEMIKDWVRAEVELYDKYLRGECYWYEAEDPDGEHIDSCGGFYGYDEWDENGLFDMAKPAIDHYLKRKKNQYFDRLKTMIQNNVPLEKRETIIHKPTTLSYV